MHVAAVVFQTRRKSNHPNKAELRLQTARLRGIPRGARPALVVSARFIWLVLFELLLSAGLAGTMPRTRHLLAPGAPLLPGGPAGLGGPDCVVSSMDWLSYCCPYYRRPGPAGAPAARAQRKGIAKNCGLAANKEWRLLAKEADRFWILRLEIVSRPS